ncbi:hypothetical protein DH2020_037487 [Rehmannia glutinosa]|uniref:AUGMIN subunit 5 n=1 Tax=Rehmannia glutinosa TaxID=99300 RepID=A0ABR0V1K5_REHGL
MQSSSGMAAQPEAILEWLQKEMGYRPLGPYASSAKAAVPAAESLRKICRGNMIPVWNFLLKRVKSDKTVENIRRNILVHGADDVDKGRRKGKFGVGKEETSSSSSREMALQEREIAEKEVERLRQIVRRQRKELKARMIEVSREEAERKRHSIINAFLCLKLKVRFLAVMVESRHKQVMLEAYDQQCDEAAKIFAEYHKRLRYYVNQARDAQRSSVDSSSEMVTSFPANNEKELYSTVKGSKSADDVILIETTRERNIRKVCESLAVQMSEKFKLFFQLMKDVQSMYKYENNTIIEASSTDISSPLQYHLYGNGKLGGDAPSRGTENQLLERQKAHVQQFLATEDALNKAAEARNMSQLLLKRLHGSGDAVSSHSIVTAGTSQNMSSLRQLEGSYDDVECAAKSVYCWDNGRSKGSFRLWASCAAAVLEVWAKEREAAGLHASLNTLMSEVHRLDKLCAERKEAENSLRKKWKKIEEFDARRSELESIYKALLKANMDAASFWSQQPLAAREYASSTIIPACNVVVDLSNNAQDLIDKEVSAFYRTPDNSLYMLPSTPQLLETRPRREAHEAHRKTPLELRGDACFGGARLGAPLGASGMVEARLLHNSFFGAFVTAVVKFNVLISLMHPLHSVQALLESMGANGSTGPEAVATAERNAAVLTARAGARDPSAVPSICRISAALQYPAGSDGLDPGLASVLESMEFCLKLRGSEACVLEDLTKAINLVHVRRDLVESGHALLNHAHRAQQEYDRTTNYCLNVASEQEKTVSEKWLPELSNAVLNAQKCLEDCKYVRGLLDEWWEQPASTVVDWVAVDGENVAAWQNHVKQLLAFYDNIQVGQSGSFTSRLAVWAVRLANAMGHVAKFYERRWGKDTELVQLRCLYQTDMKT